MRAHFQFVHQNDCSCLRFIAVTIAENHTETASVQKVQVGLSAQTFIYIADCIGYLIQYICHHIVAKHTRERVVVADVKHNDVYMLVIVERALHVVGIGAVLVQSRKRVNVILRTEHTCAYNKQRHCNGETLHQQFGNKKVYNDRHTAKQCHRKQRENFPPVEQYSVLNDIQYVQCDIRHNAYIQHMKQHSMGITVINREH